MVRIANVYNDEQIKERLDSLKLDISKPVDFEIAECFPKTGDKYDMLELKLNLFQNDKPFFYVKDWLMLNCDHPYAEYKILSFFKSIGALSLYQSQEFEISDIFDAVRHRAYAGRLMITEKEEEYEVKDKASGRLTGERKIGTKRSVKEYLYDDMAAESPLPLPQSESKNTLTELSKLGKATASAFTPDPNDDIPF